jgi:hypothetical protein
MRPQSPIFPFPASMDMPHDPEWPDKAMFAALLLIMGGILGLLVEGLRMVATVENNLPDGILASYPNWLSASMSAVTLLFGILCFRTQAAVFGYTGAVAGLFSLAYSGLVPFLSILAIGMLIKSHLEGEETRNDGIKLHSSLWPDKAMAASLFMVVGGSTAGVQGIAIAMDNYEPVVLDAMPAVAILVDLVAFVFCLFAARRVYHLRNPWLGTAAAVVCIVTLALYVIGPIFGAVILLFMALARRENEFGLNVATGIAAAPAGAPKKSKAPLAAARTPRRAAPK